MPINLARSVVAEILLEMFKPFLRSSLSSALFISNISYIQVCGILLPGGWSQRRNNWATVKSGLILKSEGGREIKSEREASCTNAERKQVYFGIRGVEAEHSAPRNSVKKGHSDWGVDFKVSTSVLAPCWLLLILAWKCGSDHKVRIN